ncbi:NlpC/P60 family protein [Streptomyces sp. NBC_01142]|uniref:C40 family peptidase n=1 Tax=Streptomyces sp. NBC_01142 TaxID=2975865 RepID=UPI0022572981|nr:NlpC/P60 family protein [Streptomyces sp. NBC_01142]MCX4818824.1 NlpC/P60 family protein [Streptomyces sp. NBC_01142]
MAAHRKRKQHPLTGPAARTAATLALAGAATATGFEGTGYADPGLTPAQIKAKVDKLYQEAEAATEKYNGVKEQTAGLRTSLNSLRDEAARRTERLNTSRNALGSIATAQYRAGSIDPGVQIALTSDPDEYLERAALADRVGERQAAAVAGVRQQLVDIAQLRAEADERMNDLTVRQSELARHKSTVQEKLAGAERLLARMTAEQRTAYDSSQGGTEAPYDVRASRSATLRGSLRAPNARAEQAIAYAYGALGKPYVWGATGPSSYDCSGLTQAAWRSAGVSLPRTTYTQISAGGRVSRSQLAPGDLVFFYSGVTHVGLYIGGGNMIHAPRPGAPVRIAPIDQMPFAGATRPV